MLGTLTSLGNPTSLGTPMSRAWYLTSLGTLTLLLRRQGGQVSGGLRNSTGKGAGGFQDRGWGQSSPFTLVRRLYSFHLGLKGQGEGRNMFGYISVFL